MMYKRSVNILKTRSFFLFGARATGKSTLLKQLFAKDKVLWLDLLDPELESELSSRPSALSERLDSVRQQVSWVVIDEVQKVPKILDVVHAEIVRGDFKFALTGSSARKLKRGAANLLAGRALQNFLFPLTSFEIDKDFNLDFVLKWGSLPEVINLQGEENSNEEIAHYLRAYTQTYLKEEIQVEQLVRKLPPFRSFLEVAAQSSGSILNFSKVARDIGSDPVSVKNYFSILEDTLVGFYLPAYHGSIRKRQNQHPKFYLFDVGVKSALSKQLNLELHPETYLYGNQFEHWVISEVHRMNHYHSKDWTLSYLRTKDDVEVDLIVERPGQKTALIEIKSTGSIRKDDVSPLSRIAKDFSNSQAFCFSRDSSQRQIDGVLCLNWREGLRQLLN
jgi:uncharacterized protein